MPTTWRLGITGYLDRPVPNELIEQDQATDRAALFLPGMGYTCDMPLFYYTESRLLEAGWDVLRVEYTHGRNTKFRALTETDRLRWVVADARAAHDALLSRRGNYRQLAIVGKSLGTLAMGALMRDERAAPLQKFAVWLTPVLSDADVRASILDKQARNLVVIGDQDPWFDSDFLEQTRTAGHAVTVIPDADHGLDVAGDIPASLAAVRTTISAIAKFLGLETPGANLTGD